MARRNSFWREFNEGWRAVDPAVNRMNEYWEQNEAADAFNEGKSQTTQNYSDNPAAVEGLDEVSDYGSSAKVRYGLGRMPTEWRDTPYSESEQTAAGYKGIGDYYRSKGKVLKALEFDKEMRNAKIQDLQTRAAENQLSDYEGRKAADEAVANYQRFGNEMDTARNSGALRGLAGELRAKVQSGEISPEQYQAAMGQYQYDSAARGAGAAVTRGYGAKEGISMQQVMLSQAKQALMSEAGKYAMKGDWKGLAEFFSNNDNYGDNMSYRYAGTDDKGNVIFEQLDAKGKVIGRDAAPPEQLMGKIEAGIDPSKGIEYMKAVTAQKRADQQHQEAMKKLDAYMARTGATGVGVKSDKEIQVPVFDAESGDYTQLAVNRVVGKDGKITYTDRTGKPIDEQVLTTGVRGEQTPFTRKLIDARKGYDAALKAGKAEEADVWQTKIDSLVRQNQSHVENRIFAKAPAQERITTIADTLAAAPDMSKAKKQFLERGAKQAEVDAAEYILRVRKGKNKPIGLSGDRAPVQDDEELINPYAIPYLP